MAAPLGKKLREARLARGLTMEDIQHQTRISLPLLVAMENDDLGAFANQTYARKFFSAYARHLAVEADGFLRQLRPAGLGGVVEHHSYLQVPTDRAGPDRRGAPATHPRHPPSPSPTLYIGLAALALAAGVAVWTGRRELQAATPTGTPTTPSASFTRSAGSTAPDAGGPTSPAAPPTTLAAFTPPDLPVRRAMPVEEEEAVAAADPSAPAAPPLPLIESPRSAAPRPAPR